MIVPMKKITLAVLETRREEFLKLLRKAGIVHVRNITTPRAAELANADKKISEVKHAVAILEQYKLVTEFEKAVWKAPDVPACVTEALSLGAHKDSITRTLDEIREKILWYKPWGAFKPGDIESLKQKGLFMRLYRAPKTALKEIKKREDTHIINRDNAHIYLARINRDTKEALHYDEIIPPNESLEELKKIEDGLSIKLERINNVLKIKAWALDSVKDYLASLQKRRAFLNVMHGMKEEKKFSCLEGFCPVTKLKVLTALSKSESFGYIAEDPDDPANTPTLIENPKWVNIIRPVFRFMNTIPGYKEYDISVWFLLFFSLFFAMLIGDAGYGIVIGAGTYFARRKLKNAPSEPFTLMYVLSFSAILWGAVTGTWFGIEKIARLPFFSALVIDKIASFSSGNQAFMMYLCFIIGIAHLTLAHIIVAARVMNSIVVLSEIGWLLILWGLFFAAGTFVLHKPFPVFATYMLITGIALKVFFSKPQKNILAGMLISLLNLPLKVIGSFADIVSYIRLFAVGYASIMLATTFNGIIMKIGFGNALSGLVSCLILVVGHTLNIALGFMAVIVHGVRLNMLEFSGQIGMEWSGREYKPFRENEIEV